MNAAKAKRNGSKSAKDSLAAIKQNPALQAIFRQKDELLAELDKLEEKAKEAAAQQTIEQEAIGSLEEQIAALHEQEINRSRHIGRLHFSIGLQEKRMRETHEQIARLEGEKTELLERQQKLQDQIRQRRQEAQQKAQKLVGAFRPPQPVR